MYKVHIMDDLFGNAVRFIVARGPSDFGYEALMSDGRWQRFEDGEMVPIDAGIRVPREVMPLIVDEIKRWQGARDDDPAVVPVLREALEIERGRVDKILSALEIE